MVSNMASLPCDKCGDLTNHFGSWDCQMAIICKKCHEIENEERSEWRWRADYCKKNRQPPHQNWAWEESGEAYKKFKDKTR